MMSLGSFVPVMKLSDVICDKSADLLNFKMGFSLNFS